MLFAEGRFKQVTVCYYSDPGCGLRQTPGLRLLMGHSGWSLFLRCVTVLSCLFFYVFKNRHYNYKIRQDPISLVLCFLKKYSILIFWA